MYRLDEYRKINNSFKKEYIFHLGAEAGFYSEFNNMVSAILYCLKYEYKFILYSKDSNFGFKNGWSDYFLPFCDESTLFIHKVLNTRTTKPRLSIEWKILLFIYKLFNRNTYFTFELWDNFYSKEFDSEIFDIPSLYISGDLRESSKEIVEMIYRFNKKTISEIQNHIKMLSLPNDYISMQIRRGDKNTEWSFIPIEKYIEKVEEISICRNIFVLADDYSTIEELNVRFKTLKIYTLTYVSETGYIHNNFVQLTKDEKKRRLIKLFASIEVIKISSLFIGTYTTNIGLFVGMSMLFEKVVSIQKQEWFQFSIDDVNQFVVK